MTRENKPEGATEKRNEYAYWAIPGAATVTYSLPLFYEIDFAVNEGYRKIPHGGIEEGGLLFGAIDEKGTRMKRSVPSCVSMHLVLRFCCLITISIFSTHRSKIRKPTPSWKACMSWAGSWLTRAAR